MKGVFTTWIKELCALVFVQTIQAFILAMVLSIILTFLFPEESQTSGVATVTSQDTVSALGVLCIVLLTSLTKMEQITKKIFGLDSSMLQNKPPHGFMASWLALKSAGRILNNVPKIVGGIGSATLGASHDKKKATSAMLNRLNKKGFDKDGNRVNAAGTSFPVNDESVQDNNSLVSSDEYYEKAKQAKKDGNMDKYYENRGIAAGINKANRAAMAAINNGGKNVPRTYTDKDRDAFEKIMDKYDDEISKAKEKRKKGIENALAGAAETIGAGIGGMTGLSIGAVSGLAMGDLDQIPKAMGYGIGIGDAAGENLSKAITSTASGIKSRVKINSQLDKQLAQMEANLKIHEQQRGSQAKRARRITEKIEKNMGNLP